MSREDHPDLWPLIHSQGRLLTSAAGEVSQVRARFFLRREAWRQFQNDITGYQTETLSYARRKARHIEAELQYLARILRDYFGNPIGQEFLEGSTEAEDAEAGDNEAEGPSA